jgi:hypothetical protein
MRVANEILKVKRSRRIELRVQAEIFHKGSAAYPFCYLLGTSHIPPDKKRPERKSEH